MKRTCCLCGASGHLVRYRPAEIRGGGMQWRCQDTDGCAERVRPNG